MRDSARLPGLLKKGGLERAQERGKNVYPTNLARALALKITAFQV